MELVTDLLNAAAAGISRLWLNSGGFFPCTLTNICKLPDRVMLSLIKIETYHSVETQQYPQTSEIFLCPILPTDYTSTPSRNILCANLFSIL